jgi:hypothetical protein
MKYSCILIATALLAGCATTILNTASGRPEVTIAAPKATVRSALVNGMVDRGYAVRRTDEFVIEGERDGGAMASVLLATPNNPTSQVRASLNLSGDDGAVRVVLRTFLVAGGREQGETTGNMKQGQDWLNQIKDRCEHK